LAELFVREGCLTCPTAEFCLEDLAWEYGTKELILVVDTSGVMVMILPRLMPAITGMLVLAKKLLLTFLSMA